MRRIVSCLLLALTSATAAAAEVGSVVRPAECTLWNPTRREMADELVRLRVPLDREASYSVVENGVEIPYQIDSGELWVCSTFAAGEEKKYQIVPGGPKQVPPRVTIRREGNVYLLDNGKIAVRVPAEGGEGMPGPIAGIRRPDGQWVGASTWSTQRKLKRLVVSEAFGTIYGKATLRYEFEGMAGLENNIGSFAEVEVKLGPGWSHVEITERHEMSKGDYWELDLGKGWTPASGFAQTYGGGLGGEHPNPKRPLKPVVHQAYDPGVYLTLQPRWNQNYADGWAFCATDATNYAGAVVVRASRWVWPHQNALKAIVRESGDYAGLRCPMWKGERLWWLVASAEPADVKYVARHAWESLDKLNHEMILAWPGQKPTGVSWMNIYDNITVNPTSSIRQFNRKALADAGKPGNYGTLALQQVIMHPDSYGSYWNYWTPCNPNFFSDFYTRGIVLVSNLKEHPRYEELRQAAALKVREDIYHSVAMPSGAGQECPGYMAISKWREFATICKEQLGIEDKFVLDRIAAAERFRKRVSQPDGTIRRRLPIGDTHNGPDGPRIEDVPADEAAKWTSTELAGFGVIFNAKPATPQETYLSFKSGANRGHYHGDQLSFHYCADGRPLAVDHHCSYHPRAGQDHMHNRLAFFTDDMPYANQGGYERLIAFKATLEADVAMGQVESSRLTVAEAYPPERWWQRFPRREFAQPLTYRRSIVLVKGTSDYFVIRDQYWSPDPINAAFCLHVLHPETIAVRAKTGESDGSERFSDPAQDFAELKIPAGSTLLIYGATWKQGEQRPEALEIRAVEGKSLVLSQKLPAAKGLSYVVLRNLIRRDEAQRIEIGRLSLFVAAPRQFTVASHPWFHENGGMEQTQGLRLHTQGRSAEFITVMSAVKLAEVSAMAGGVRVGADEITFAGDQPTSGDATAYVVVKRHGREVVRLTGQDIDMNRSQGEMGLCMPDGGDVPDWLIKQRHQRPPWAR